MAFCFSGPKKKKKPKKALATKTAAAKTPTSTPTSACPDGPQFPGPEFRASNPSSARQQVPQFSAPGPCTKEHYCMATYVMDKLLRYPGVVNIQLFCNSHDQYGSSIPPGAPRRPPPCRHMPPYHPDYGYGPSRSFAPPYNQAGEYAYGRPAGYYGCY